jgi:DNA-binding response OmpR family regulator
MKLLVIEDEHKIANSIKKGLEQESYAVDVAYNGTSGLDLATVGDYDIIILDLMLPDIDGLTICKKLRSSGNHTPILMLTARGQLDDKVTGLNSGADDYLVKPFAFTELLARIKALTRRPKESFGTLLNFENLSLNTLTYEVRLSGKPIQITRKEFALLEYLLRHKNTIVTKDQIINNTWDYDSNILPNTVEVYIGYLRKKIPGFIHTVRGFGYRLGAEK